MDGSVKHLSTESRNECNVRTFFSCSALLLHVFDQDDASNLRIRALDLCKHRQNIWERQARIQQHEAGLLLNDEDKRFRIAIGLPNDLDLRNRS